VCRTGMSDAVTGPGVAALAAAHRRNVARLADEVGQRLKALAAGEAVRC